MSGARKSDPARVLTDAVRTALEAITRSDTISDSAAHRSRKATKKARTALRLLRVAIGEAVYRRQNTALRNASRTISPLRDAKAQIDIFNSLKDRHPKLAVNEVMPFESKLRDKLRRLRATVHRRAPRVRRSVGLLETTRQVVGSLHPNRIHRDDVNEALRKFFRQVRKTFRAAQDRPTTASLHEWRKKTKYLANAVDVIGKRAHSSYVSLAKSAARVGDWLGEDHDLAVLVATIHRDRTLSGASKNGFQAAIEARRSKLQKKAFRLGRKLCAQKP